MTTKINLLELAKSVEDTHKEVELSFGKIKVYHVPDPLVWSYRLDRPRQIQPTVKMKLATGQSQERPIKAGDEGWDEWLAETEEYEDELADLRLAARYVHALRDLDYPDISAPPPMAQARYNGHWPANEILRKKIWLDFSVFAHAGNLAKIQTALMEMNSLVTEDMVEEVKKNSA